MRRYSEEDISAIVRLEEKTLGTTLGEAHYQMDLSNPLAYHFVLERNNEIAGFISCIFDGEVVEVLNFCIDPRYQSQGLGKSLLIQTFQYFIPLRMKRYVLEVRESNERAIALYKKLGFQTIHVRKGYYEGKEDAYFMERVFLELYEASNLAADILCMVEKKDGLSKYSCPTHPYKYDLNFILLNEKRISPAELELLKCDKKSYLNIFTDYQDDSLFKGYQEDEVILMYCNAYGYQPLRSSIHPVEMLQAEDEEELKKMLYEDALVFGHTYAQDNARFSVEAYHQHKTHILVTKCEGKMVGAMFLYLAKGACFIEDFFVLEAYQRQGFGSSLLNTAIAYVLSQGVQDIYLEADPKDTPIKMYERMNFRRCKSNYSYLLEHI